jgi:cation diffusion facilitator CzcD-associated flavoprotein CzcO
MNRVFADQGTNQAVNDVVAEFVRSKIRQIVKDPAIAERLCPYDHPIGSRRLCVDTNYYSTYNHDNVSLIDIAADPIVRMTETGIQTRDAHYEVDLIVFAIGFNAFRGALDRVDIRNEAGETPTTHWNRGPRTMLGLMTTGFPNLFLLTGPGSPSVLANMVIMNEEHVNWVADLIGYMDQNDFASVEPKSSAQQQWTEEVAAAAAKLLRLGVKNYMVHVNPDDGSRVFMPYIGGLDRYVQICRDIAAKRYQGFSFKKATSEAPEPGLGGLEAHDDVAPDAYRRSAHVD